jgi:hypothetical protein
MERLPIFDILSEAGYISGPAPLPGLSGIELEDLSLLIRLGTIFLIPPIDGNVFWLRADRGISKAGNNRMASWTDQGKEKMVFSVGDPEWPDMLRFLWSASDANFNNKPVVINNTPVSEICVDKSIIGTDGNLTAFFVTSIILAGQIIISGQHHLPHGVLRIDTGTEPGVDPSLMTWTNGEYGQSVSSPLPVFTADAAIVTLVQDAENKRIKFYYNGSLFCNADATEIIFDTGWDTIMACGSLPIKWAEAVVFNSVLTSQQIGLVHWFLNQEYKIY